MRSTRSTGSRGLRLVLALGLAVLVSPAHAQEGHAHSDLGKVEFPISCSRAAQAEFDHALALLHHMTYPQAREAFTKVTKAEPKCAMAHWGVAMTLFQPLWPTRPSPAALRQGWEEVQAAKNLPANDRERLFIAAAEAFFAEPESADYWSRIRRWEQASAKAHDALPEDAEVTLFYALAHLATAPATGGRDHADKAAEMLVEVYERQPDHPGVMHYLVHANDVPGRERELLEVTRKYDRLAPNNPHALHMPTHIYTRLGDWNAVVSGNLRAADAALLHPAGPQREFVWDEFAHAIEYLVYAYLQQADDDDASKQLQRLHGVKNLEPSFKTAFHLASTRSRYALERHAWSEAAAIEPRTPSQLEWDRYMWAEATARFARGLGAAHLGKLEDARSQVQKMEALEATAVKGSEDLFARNIRVQRLALAAWVAHKQGERAKSVSIMREAAALEVATPKHAVTPGPTLPAYELLGDLLAEQKDFAPALDAYRESLKLYPRRLNSLLGAARAANVLGDSASARLHYKELLEVAGQSSTRKDLIAEARRNLN